MTISPIVGSHTRPSAVTIETMGVVVPARNEEFRLPRCLAALESAADALRHAEASAPRVRIIVVVDGCTDRTREIAASWPGVEVVISDAGRVGAARGSGVGHLLATEAAAGTPAQRVWAACTDADSAVPTDWLQTQFRLASAGFEMLLGTVRPDPTELGAGVLAAWRLRHQNNDDHPHVHGANLGVRGDTYVVAGGFKDVAVHEDLLLSRSVRLQGGRVCSTGASPVLTSGRTHGRAPTGMATYLRELAAIRSR